ncbi:class I SAM-dependent methyltransferase [Chloroflexota bacterium]
MSRLETIFIRSPLRVFLQRKYEAEKVLYGLDVPPDSVCLEIGCGLGAGTLLINKYLDCRQVIGVDIDRDMIESAKKYIYRPPGWAEKINTHNIEFSCQDSVELLFSDCFFEVVILFGVLDHIKDWRRVINEVFRVLKPGGIFSFEEFLLGKSAEKWFGHVSICKQEMEEALTHAGFRIRSFETGKLIPHCFVRAEKRAINEIRGEGK